MRSVIPVIASLGILLPACKKDQGESRANQEEATKDKAAQQAENDETANAAAENKPAPDPALIERGTYLSNLMGCEQCHTPFGPKGPDQSKRFAGGLEVPEEFGTWRSPNITQDKETGIGSWSDEQIIAAVREGKRPDGEQLYPMMPYLGYNIMSDDDARALVAFLRTIEPIKNRVERATDLKLPKIPAPPAKGLPASTDDAVAHGQYLASLMHCASCHTPMTKKGPDMSKMFAGGMKISVPMLGEGVLFTSNLTPHETGIKDWTDEELVSAIMQMKKRDGTIIQGPMALYQAGWSQIPREDIEHVVAFLRSLDPIEHKVPESTFRPRAAPAPH